MPEAERAKKKVRRPVEGILSPEQAEARMKALRDHEGRWVAWNRPMHEVLASGETIEELDEIVERLRAASPGEDRLYSTSSSSRP